MPTTLTCIGPIAPQGMNDDLDFRPVKAAAQRLPQGSLREGILSQPDFLPREIALRLTVTFYRQCQQEARAQLPSRSD